MLKFYRLRGEIINSKWYQNGIARRQASRACNCKISSTSWLSDMDQQDASAKAATIRSVQTEMVHRNARLEIAAH